jgi:chaperonin GroEL
MWHIFLSIDADQKLAAVEEGIVVGGGVAYLNGTKALDRLSLSGDEATGVSIVRRALEEPLRQLAINAGIDGSAAVELVRRYQQEKGSNRWGYDVLREEYCDLIERGIIDPAKVARSAIQNATSIAAMVLTTETLVSVSELPGDPSKPSPPIPIPPGEDF